MVVALLLIILEVVLNVKQNDRRWVSHIVSRWYSYRLNARGSKYNIHWKDNSTWVASFVWSRVLGG